MCCSSGPVSEIYSSHCKLKIPENFTKFKTIFFSKMLSKTLFFALWPIMDFCYGKKSFIYHNLLIFKTYILAQLKIYIEKHEKISYFRNKSETQLN